MGGGTKIKINRLILKHMRVQKVFKKKIRIGDILISEFLSSRFTISQ